MGSQYKVLMAGMGDDTAMLIAELYERGYEPDEIVFCDTGSEFPHTYKFIEYLKKWIEGKKWSKLTILRKFDKLKKPMSVISMCVDGDTLPAAAFGSPSCSMKFKKDVADVYFNSNTECLRSWGVGKSGARLNTYKGKVLRMVGINADEPIREAKWREEHKYVQIFPLYDWGIGELESTAVERVGLYYPGKSSCVICPNLTHSEIAMLNEDYPEIYNAALKIEDNYRRKNLVKSDQVDMFGAESYNNTVVGLGGLKGKTWDQMLSEYKANPRKYRIMTDKKPCDCGH
jgi:3'-phosphoadenosine 5'-phosphosulfate sulfotransferase (PAPS reductase)/FAD synthetase